MHLVTTSLSQMTLDSSYSKLGTKTSTIAPSGTGGAYTPSHAILTFARWCFARIISRQPPHRISVPPPLSLGFLLQPNGAPYARVCTSRIMAAHTQFSPLFVQLKFRCTKFQLNFKDAIMSESAKHSIKGRRVE